MKKYLLEIEQTKIWSYKVQGEGREIDCELLRPFGEESYPLKEKDGPDKYWQWFQRATSIPSEMEIDICFLYEDAAHEAYETLLASMPSFKNPVKTSWRLSELRCFLREYRVRKRTETAEYQNGCSQFRLPKGERILVSGLGAFQLAMDEEAVLPPSVAAGKSCERPAILEKNNLSSVRKPKVKVYAPNSNTIDLENKREKPSNREMRRSLTLKKGKVAAHQELSASLSTEPMEKVTAKDMQKYFQEQTAGQCDTVLDQSKA